MTPADAVIKAMEELQSVFKQHSNKGIAAEMEVLKQMDEYLNGKTCNTTLTPKRVTFESSAPIKTMATTPNNNKPSPRVSDTLPGVVTSAVMDKPYGAPQGITTRSCTKAQQLAMATQHQHHVDSSNCKLAFEAAINIMKCNLRSKTAQAIFDKNWGKCSNIGNSSLTPNTTKHGHTHPPMNLGI